jgi:SAM-dependent methyltransferase
MWADSREALVDLSLPSRERVLDVGCGTGELSRVLAEETPGEVIGVDADTDLLAVAREEANISVIAGDATRLPVPDKVADLVVCQALLVNLPDPAAALAEFARASSDLVAAIEPNNAQVGVDSTVEREVTLEQTVREAYLEGVETDVALGSQVPALFEAAGLEVLSTRRYHHHKQIEPPYSEGDLQDAARKASGAGLADHETELRRELGADEYDHLRTEWREMGRAVVEQMQAGQYRRAEVVPFDVIVGQVAGEG